MQLGPKYQRFGFKSPRAELLRQRQGSFRVSKCCFEIHQRVPAEESRVMTNHLCPTMPDSCRSSDRGIGDRHRASRVSREPLAEPVVGTDHPSANVLSVTETAERHGLKLGRPATSCKFQRDPMFPQAA